MIAAPQNSASTPKEIYFGLNIPSNDVVFRAYRSLSAAVFANPVWFERYKVGGVAIGQTGLEVFVEKDIFKTELGELIAKTINIGFNVRVTGSIVTAAQGGDSVRAGAGRRVTGTLGCLVKDTSGAIFGLSCDHVIGVMVGQAIGDPVCSPASMATRIGSLAKSSGVVLSITHPNRIDAALFNLDQPSKHFAGINGLPGAPTGPCTSISFGDPLRKSGSATKVTNGQFSYIVTMRVPYYGGHALFVDQIGIDGGGKVFANGGDSGALVVNDSGEAVGLLFAAAPGSCLGFANPIDAVLAGLGVAII